MERDKFMRDYWNYYRMLEDDFRNTLRYIEMDARNFETFSKEYVRQYQSICAEIEVLFKAILELDGRKTITEYAKGMLNKYPAIQQYELNVLLSNLKLSPFRCWNENAPAKSLSWWEDYQNVKHNRIIQPEKARMKNVLYALGALYILEKVLYKGQRYPVDCIDQESMLFRIEGWTVEDVRFGDRYIKI